MTDVAVDGPSGIGGWLLLPAIGVVLVPLLLIPTVADNIGVLRGGELTPEWSALRTAVVGQTALLVGYLAFALLVAMFFFMRRAFVPRLMLVYLIATWALSLVLAAWTSSVLGAWPADSAISIVAAGVSTLVWGRYFLVSRRVRNTFVT